MSAPPKMILVVDDDETLRMTISMVLEMSGFRVLTAEDGQDALEKVGRELPDAILLDMKMPVMNGWEFIRVFRQRYGRSVPVIVITAAQDAGGRAAEVDADGFIEKPFEIQILLDQFERHFGRSGANAA